MSSQISRRWRNPFALSPEEGSRFADVVAQIVPGGGGLIRQLFRAKKDFLRGMSQSIEAEIQDLEAVDAAIADTKRPRWKGGIALGLAAIPVQRALAIQQELSRVEGEILQGLADGIEQKAAENAKAQKAVESPGTGGAIKIKID